MFGNVERVLKELSSKQDEKLIESQPSMYGRAKYRKTNVKWGYGGKKSKHRQTSEERERKRWMESGRRAPDPREEHFYINFRPWTQTAFLFLSTTAQTETRSANPRKRFPKMSKKKKKVKTTNCHPCTTSAQSSHPTPKQSVPIRDRHRKSPSLPFLDGPSGSTAQLCEKRGINPSPPRKTTNRRRKTTYSAERRTILPL